MGKGRTIRHAMRSKIAPAPGMRWVPPSNSHLSRVEVTLNKTVRTTLALPADLLEAVDQAVRVGKAKSRNELVAASLRHHMAALERAAIDAAFAEMAHDRDYQEEARNIAEEFASSDWEAFQLGENR